MRGGPTNKQDTMKLEEMQKAIETLCIKALGLVVKVNDNEYVVVKKGNDYYRWYNLTEGNYLDAEKMRFTDLWDLFEAAEKAIEQ
jgi:hypothetical protein